MSQEVYIVKRQKDKSGWVIILLAAAMLAFWKWLLAIGIVMIVAGCTTWVITHIVEAIKARKNKQISRNASLALRAEHENQLAAMGDPAGVYGQFDAYTMPMTGHLLDNYNDGLKDWK